MLFCCQFVPAALFRFLCGCILVPAAAPAAVWTPQNVSPRQAHQQAVSVLLTRPSGHPSEHTGSRHTCLWSPGTVEGCRLRPAAQPGCESFSISLPAGAACTGPDMYLSDYLCVPACLQWLSCRICRFREASTSQLARLSRTRAATSPERDRAPTSLVQMTCGRGRDHGVRQRCALRHAARAGGPLVCSLLLLLADSVAHCLGWHSLALVLGSPGLLHAGPILCASHSSACHAHLHPAGEECVLLCG